MTNYGALRPADLSQEDHKSHDVFVERPLAAEAKTFYLERTMTEDAAFTSLFRPSDRDSWWNDCGPHALSKIGYPVTYLTVLNSTKDEPSGMSVFIIGHSARQQHDSKLNLQLVTVGTTNGSWAHTFCYQCEPRELESPRQADIVRLLQGASDGTTETGGNGRLALMSTIQGLGAERIAARLWYDLNDVADSLRLFESRIP